ncbi:MAG: hypothetical protein MAGBODY4_00363 [Candidatus Marinimicrobia bacterium]|nr:hypothetical protein [Candidatus Neomarinimicrobiota bacterium]
MKLQSTNTTYLLTAILLLIASFLVYQKESNTEWKQYQSEYYSQANLSDSADIKIISMTPTLTGEPELCLTCHIGIEQISEPHPVESFGCITCHGGNGMTLDKERAHASLIGGRNPSGLSTVRQSCGTSPTGVACHTGFTGDESWRNMIDRVEQSLQATEAGAIAQVRYTFGISQSLHPEYGTRAVQDDSVLNPDFPHELGDIFEKIEQDSLSGNIHPMEEKFVKNCLASGCHLNSDGIDKEYYHRSAGCASCHVLSDNDGLYKGADVTIDAAEPGHGKVHEMTVSIPYSQCNHCHNRGIYSLKQMKFIERDDLDPHKMQFMSAQERRDKDYYIPMAQYASCEVTLDCIDCHTHNEIMGDGDIYPEKKAAVEVQCATCHGTIESPPEFAVIKSLEQEDVFIADINEHLSPQVGDTVAVTKRGTLFPSVKKVDGRWQQTSKVDGTLYPIPLAHGSTCTQKLEEQDSPSCHQCHDVSDKSDLIGMK